MNGTASVFFHGYPPVHASKHDKKNSIMTNKRVFAFDRINFILLAVGMAIVILGFILMSGGGSSAGEFDPEIFNARRIKVAPVICFFGYLFIIYAIARKPRDKKADKEMTDTEK